MKHLQDLLIEELIFNNKTDWEFDYSDLGYSFKDFVIENIISDDALSYARKIFDNLHWNSGFGDTLNRYAEYQNLFYETLDKTYNSYSLIERIKSDFEKSIISVDKYEKGSIKADNLFMIKILALDDITQTKVFTDIINFYNYSVIKHYDKSKHIDSRGIKKIKGEKQKIDKQKINKDGLYEIILKPVYSEDKTKYVNSQEYIYHVTNKENLQSILKYGIQPKDKNEDYHKVYILVKNKNFEDHLQSLIGKKSEKILLTIDLSKKSEQNRFFLDDGATGYDAYYTREEIPEYCIVKYEIIKKKNI